jgi:hypothetical protein
MSLVDELREEHGYPVTHEVLSLCRLVDKKLHEINQKLTLTLSQRDIDRISRHNPEDQE